MKKFLYLMVLLTSVVGLSLPVTTFAATLTFNAATTLSLPNGVGLTILNNGTVESLVVNDNSTLSLTFGVDTDIVIRSNDVYVLDSTTGTQTCVGGSYNQLRFNSTSGSDTVTVVQTAACLPSSSGGTSSGGGGGGGGAGVAPTAPTSTSVVINGGNSQTASRDITLTLGATNAALMLIANQSDFSDAGSWEDYATTKSWTLIDGLGTKTVYAKFRGASGGESAAVSDTIELVAATAPAEGEIVGNSGGSLSLTDGTLSVNLTAGAITGTGTLMITPQTDYALPPTNLNLVGSQVYDLTLIVNDQAVTNFNQPVTLTFTYSDADVSGLDETSLQVYYWDSASSQWKSLGGNINLINNTITVDTTHFTQFAIFGQSVASSPAAAGSLVKKASSPAVYYLGSDNKLHVFVSAEVYFTWYSDFSGVQTISDDTFNSYGFGVNVFPRPGVKLIQAVDGETPWNIVDPKVYVVAANGMIRHITNAAAAAVLFGANWESKIIPIVISEFTRYPQGGVINSAIDFNPTSAQAAAPTINDNQL